MTSSQLEETMMHAQMTRHAHVNGVELEYDIAGRGEPVLFISPVLADGFLPLLSEPCLAHRYQLITYHKRGWMGSTHTPPPVSVADHAADAAALLGHLDVRRAHIAGHSSGAAVALQLALTHPEMVHTLALLELSLLSVPGAAGFLQKAGPAFEAYAAGRHDVALAMFMSAVSGLEWEGCRSVLDSRVPGAVTAAIKDADTFFGIELPGLTTWTFGAAEAASISQPVLSVLGTNTEPLWIEIANVLRTWLPQIEDCTIEGAGHLLHIQRPEAVAQRLGDFFDRHRMPVANQIRARGQRSAAAK
jgi:pimeloyl-ACP methyl ester carboxylesterase